MPKGKKYQDALRRFDRAALHDPEAAFGLVPAIATATFDESVDVFGSERPVEPLEDNASEVNTAREHVIQQLPAWLRHASVMGIDAELASGSEPARIGVASSGQMDLEHAIQWKTVDELERVEPEIDGLDPDVVYVEQESTISSFEDRTQEVRLLSSNVIGREPIARSSGRTKPEHVCAVLESNDGNDVAHAAEFVDDVTCNVCREGYW